jgi:glutathione S-transferase
MITLCGFALSNYYNKVKMVLLEKGLPFEERYVATGGGEDVLQHSPMGKIPFLLTEQGALSESQAIVNYLEEIAPQPALQPADPWQRAKVQELCTYVELHIELVVRDLYPQAFFGGTVSESTQARVRRQLSERSLPAFRRLAKFSPYLAGDTFTLADVSAYVSLPLAGLATRIIYGEDLLLAQGVDWKAHAKLVGQRESAQKVDADRKAAQAAMAARAKG